MQDNNHLDIDIDNQTLIFDPASVLPKDHKNFGAHKLNISARDVYFAHHYGGRHPNRKARRAMAAFDRSQRARVAAYNNQRLIPPGAIHPYAE